MNKKVLSIGLIAMALMIASVFAASFALADNNGNGNGKGYGDIEDKIAKRNAKDVNEIIDEDIDANDVGNVMSETENFIPPGLAKPEKQLYAGIARVSLGDGYAVKSDDSAAERVRALWVSARYITANQTLVKELIKQYKNQPEKLREELAKITTEEVVTKAAGRLVVGIGSDRGNFKLIKKEFTNTSVSFYVMPMNVSMNVWKNGTDEELAALAVGTLSLNAKVYPHLTMWNGTLTLNKGDYTGTWNVVASSDTKTITKKAIVTGSGEVKVVPVKAGFWQRFVFWKKQAAEDNDEEEEDED